MTENIDKLLLKSAIDSGSEFNPASQVIEEIDFALEQGADINAKLGDKWSALRYAVYFHDDLAIASHIIARGADVNAINHHGRTPLLELIDGIEWKRIPYERADKGIRFLLNQKVGSRYLVDVNIGGPLYFALRGCDDMDIPKQLIERGADPNGVAYSNETIFFLAVRNLPYDKIRFLINNGAVVDAPDLSGCTPLLVAALYNPDIQVLKLLIENGANYQYVAPGGYTILTQASGNKNIEIIKYVVDELGVNDVNAKLENGWTALHAAALSNSNPDIIDFLLSKGAIVNEIADNKTPLDLAIVFEENYAYNKKQEAIMKKKILIEAGGKLAKEILQ